MRTLLIMLGLAGWIGVAGTMVGCEESRDEAGADVEVEVESSAAVGEGAAEEVKQEGAVTGADVGRDFSEAFGTAGKYAAEKHEAMIQAAGKKLATMDDDIERLKEKGAELGGAAKSRWEQMKIDLEEKAAAAKEELAKMKVAGAAALDEASVELGKALEEVGDAYEEAAKDFEAAGGEGARTEEGTPIQP